MKICIHTHTEYVCFPAYLPFLWRISLTSEGTMFVLSFTKISLMPIEDFNGCLWNKHINTKFLRLKLWKYPKRWKCSRRVKNCRSSVIPKQHFDVLNNLVPCPWEEPCCQESCLTIVLMIDGSLCSLTERPRAPTTRRGSTCWVPLRSDQGSNY